jgi:CRP-like cAMP-binding protein
LTEIDFERELAQDAQLAARVAAAADREFDFLRERAAGDRLSPPLSRLASYLLAVSGLEAHERRDGTLLLEPVINTYVAESLQLPLADLSELVGELSRRGAVVDTSAGLVICDRQALEQAAGEG